MTIYLDYNATTPLDPQVFEAMRPYLQGRFGNPSALYRLGREARAAVEQAREQVASLVNAHPSQVIFTSGGTEANNFAIKGCLAGMGLGRLAISAIEHASVQDVARSLPASIQVAEIPVDASGRVDEQSMRRCLAGGIPQLVSVMMANNETGVIQAIERLSSVAGEYKALFHTDAVQAAGKMPVDFPACGAQLMSLSAHKLYGPKGVGALIVDKSLSLTPLIQGGGQEKGRRSGTENVAAIVGFGLAAEQAKTRLASRQQKLRELQSYLESRLRAIEGISLFAAEAERLANTSFFALDGIDGESLLMSLDVNEVAVASGSACASKKGTASHVLLAMGVDETLARGAIRVSLGKDNSRADIDRFIEVLTQQAQVARRLSVLSH